MNLLAVSFAYPPLAYPRSIQVARLIKYLDASTVLVCADEPGVRNDATLEPDAEVYLRQCIRLPFEVSRFRSVTDRLSHRLHRPFWNRRNMAPDKYLPWKKAVLDSIHKSIDAEVYKPDVLATFGQPFTDHLIGLELKRRYNLPWLAHFSDPWVDNPFNTYDEGTRRLNLKLEHQVIEAADILAFTSSETIDLVMDKYPTDWRRKACVLPQSFDPKLFEVRALEKNDKIVLRYIGNFYGHRTPSPLVSALRQILESGADRLTDVTVELVGLVDAEAVRQSGGDAFRGGLLTVRPPVGYRESLNLMSEADGLLIIDAPADKSVFLPSKLIDYVGAGRPVLGLTPPGAAASLIRELGGHSADSADTNAMAIVLKDFIDYLRQRRMKGDFEPWGTRDVRERYEATRVAGSFEAMLRDMQSGSAPLLIYSSSTETP